MEQKTLSLVLKLVIVGLAAAGMIVYFAALPLLGKSSSPPIRNTAAAICRGFRFFGHSHSLLCFALPRMESGGGSGPGQFLFHEKCPLSACHRLSGRSGRRVFLCWKYRLFAVGSKPPKYLPVLLLYRVYRHSHRRSICVPVPSGAQSRRAAGRK